MRLHASFKENTMTNAKRKPRVQVFDLTPEQEKLLSRAIWHTWGQIAPDAMEAIDDGDNECAIELCIDADRLTFHDGGDGKAADELIDELIKKHSYAAVLKTLSKRIALL
jgi:hypothetical protein